MLHHGAWSTCSFSHNHNAAYYVTTFTLPPSVPPSRLESSSSGYWTTSAHMEVKDLSLDLLKMKKLFCFEFGEYPFVPYGVPCWNFHTPMCDLWQYPSIISECHLSVLAVIGTPLPHLYLRFKAFSNSSSQTMTPALDGQCRLGLYTKIKQCKQ